MPYLVEKSTGFINEVVLGATSENGGTRTSVIKVGGESSLPYQSYEGANPNRPVIAAEIIDCMPKDWPESLKEAWGGCLENPAEWAKKAVENGADMVFVKLISLNPDNGGRSIEECVATVKEVLGAVGVPVAVSGCGIDELDKQLIPKLAEDCQGENLLIGLAKQDNYATYAAACMSYGHAVLSGSPLDINLCKQLHILLSEMNVPANRIVMDPSIGGLGYGLEYSYSVMERGRIGALQGDKMLSMPVLGFIGQESWKAKEASASEEEFPKWGDQKDRGILWEVVTATSLMQSGIDIMVMRHPEAMNIVKKQIDEVMMAVNA